MADVLKAGQAARAAAVKQRREQAEQVLQEPRLSRWSAGPGGRGAEEDQRSGCVASSAPSGVPGMVGTKAMS